MPHKSLVFSSHLEHHQIFWNHLLSLDWMEKLLVSDQVPSSLFGVFQLLKLNHKNILQLLEILLHIIDFNTAWSIKSNRFELAREPCFYWLHFCFKVSQLLITFINKKLIVLESRAILIHMSLKLWSSRRLIHLETSKLLNHFLSIIFMNVPRFIMLLVHNTYLLLKSFEHFESMFENGITLLYEVFYVFMPFVWCFLQLLGIFF